MSRRLLEGLVDGAVAGGVVWDFAAWQATQRGAGHPECPRPDKTRHELEAHARLELDRMHARRTARGQDRPAGTLVVYPCSWIDGSGGCGGWHIGNAPKRSSTVPPARVPRQRQP